MSFMPATHKESQKQAVARVVIMNPAILERIIDAAQRGVGRNYTETAENLILAGCDALRAKEPASASSAR